MHSRYATDKGAYVVTTRSRIDDHEIHFLRQTLSGRPDDHVVDKSPFSWVSLAQVQIVRVMAVTLRVKQQDAVHLLAKWPDSMGTD